MRHYVAVWLAIAVVYLLVDAVWLGVVMVDFYSAQLGPLLRDETNFVLAAAFYVFYAAGIVILAVAPAARGGGPRRALLLGAVLGLCVYGAYDITNLAILNGWTVPVAIVDIVWGTTLTALSAAFGLAVLRWRT